MPRAADCSVADLPLEWAFYAETMNSIWESVARSPHPSGYLDPLVARQKREAHLQLVRRWLRGLNPQSVLKTDLFEEAFGEDRVLFDLAPGAKQAVGIDIAVGTIAAARRHCPAAGFSFLASDVRALALRTGSFELVFSNSTLDHFETRAELLAALRELVRVVRPSGLLAITLDNPWNPLYPLLRRLEAQGLLTSEWREEDKRNKRFYRLSGDGERIFAQLLGEWQAINAAIHLTIDNIQ